MSESSSTSNAEAGTGARRERSPRRVIQGAASNLPLAFFANAGITPDEFNSCFVHSGEGIFQLMPGLSLGFTHAVLTTGDRPTNLVTGRSGSAGQLWRVSAGNSIRNEQCCVNNCPNPNCTSTSPQPAGATAHVYATFQLSHHDIKFIILLPTCSYCNNWLTCIRTETNFSTKGQNANVLYTVDSASRIVRVMFVEASEKTITGKGNAGKGTGKGGDVKGGTQLSPKGGLPHSSNVP